MSQSNWADSGGFLDNDSGVSSGLDASDTWSWHRCDTLSR